MKTLLALIISCFAMNLATAQPSHAFQSDPKLVLEQVFKAAQTEDYSKLALLCPPDKSNDGDTQQFICDIASASDDGKKEFLSYFKDAKITGEVEYSEDEQSAKIAFWFNHPGGESRSNETMNFVKIDGKWYLSGF